jgi:endonuclease YncB( thermonuclease family)
MRMMVSAVFASSIMLLSCGAAAAQEKNAPGNDSLGGMARVVDGSTLALQGALVRFVGVLAPGLGQICQRDGRDWPCGQEAAQRLAKLIAGRPVRCTVAGRDEQGGLSGLCFAGETELNRAMVADGLAVTNDPVGLDYGEPEAEAKATGRPLGRQLHRSRPLALPTRGGGEIRALIVASIARRAIATTALS